MQFPIELETLIRARYPILYIISSEEMRVQSMVMEIARKRQKKVFEWSYNTGIVPAGTSIQSQKHRNAATKDPLMALDQVIEQVEPALFIFKDFHPFLAKNNFAIIRKLKEIALGLTLGEAENVFAKIIVKDERLSGDDVNEVFAEKQQIIRKSGLLEYYASSENFSNVGGLAVLKEWLNKRAVAFTNEARTF